MTADPVTLIPHVWVQKSAPGCPDLLAGQLFTSEGRPAYYGAQVYFGEPDGRGRRLNHYSRLSPIWLQPKTQQGLDDLFTQLLADAKRAQGNAA